jgi:hypothetical protein
MAVDQLPKPNATRRGDTRFVKYDEYIDQQVESTRRVVKIVDLATSLVVLSAGVLAYLLVVAMVEHWLVPGGFSELGRLGLFLVLAWGVGAFAIRRLWPLLIGRVNPVYAAHAIELSGPTLKNSLVNLLLFRQKRAQISDAVYHTLEEQAAQRLSRVPLDSAVDRTSLIRFGYLLVAIVAIAGLYKVLSPKDPIVAARRVLMPWAHIVPASRVSILDVQPGVVTVSRGEFVNVSAEVRGIGDDDNVTLRFTTADGQAIDKSVAMKLSRDHLRYEGRLPVGDEAGPEIGLTQDILYRIEAGDARTLDYAVKVVEAPSILVERIEYDYPEYTGNVDREVKELGDIRAIEGTRITVHARANGPIKQAHVDFDADGRRELTMQNRDATATASFVLALREDRQTPEHASYVLRFENQNGRPNRNPVKHSIDVRPDYAPEATIVLPRDKMLDVRLNETVAIEVEARDPDFALADVRLRGRLQNRDVLDEPLLKPGHKGRLSARYQFKPAEHELKAGDIVEYWVAANDNRTPTPNSTDSNRQQFRIVSPDPQQQPPPDRLAQRDPPGNQQGEGQQGEGSQNDGQPGEKQPQDGKAGQGEQKGQPPQGEGGQRQPSENQQPQQGGEDGQGQGQKGQPQDGNQASRDGQQGPNGENNPDGPDQKSKQTGAGAAGGESSNGELPADTRHPDQPDAGSSRPDGNSSAKPADGKGETGDQQKASRRPGEPPSPQNAEPSPVSSDGDNDGEAFERIQQHMKRTGEMKDGESPADEKSSRDAQPTSNQQQARGDEAKGKQGDPDRKQKAAAKQERRGEKKNPQQTPDANQDAQNHNERGAGGAEKKGGDAKPDQKQPDKATEQTDSPGGQQTSTKGESGAGDEQKSQGAPNTPPDMKPADKREQQASPGEESNQQEPPAGARGKKQSDSQGEEGGDQPGGGEEGGGQKAPRDGTGSAGQNQSADEGAGESSEKGVGSNSPDAGQDAIADKKTGQSSEDKTGQGSKTRESREGAGEKEKGKEGEGQKGIDQEQKPSQDGHNQPAGRDGKPDQKSAASEENKAPQGAENTDQGGSKTGGSKANQPRDPNPNSSQSGTPTGSGGENGAAATAPPPSTGAAPPGDEANLEYARKQTDLVLEKLADQLNQKNVDENLLKGLGWSEEDLRKFVDRWQGRKKAAEQNDPSGDAAKRELNEALRSLGLRQGPMKQGKVQDDTMRDLQEGYRGPIPLEYQERLRAYNEGVSRSRAEDD